MPADTKAPPPAHPSAPPPAHPSAPPPPEPRFTTKPYPVAEDPGVTHQKQLAALAEKLESLRLDLATQLDSDALAALQSAVVELAGLAGVPVPVPSR